MVQTLTLGKTHITVPALCIGTWAWGDKLFWSYGKDYGQDQVRAAFDASLAAGINFFDTAEVYGFGLSEELLGQFIQTCDRPVHIATKYFPTPWRVFGSSVTNALTASLKRLQVPRVDLYQVHQPFAFLMSQATLLNNLADEVQRGRIGAIGVSNYSAQQMREAHKILSDRGIPLAVNQVRYSLLSRQIETNGILETARELGVTILAYSPLSQGLLTGKYSADTYTPPTGGRRADPRFSKEGLTKLEPVITALKEIAAKYNRTPSQVALNWLIAQGNIIPIPGAKTAEQAQENAGAVDWSLTPEDVAQLDQVTRPWRV